MTLADFLNELSICGLESFRKYYSVYEGIVQDSADPEKLARLKVVIPAITGAEVTGWVPVRGMPAGRTSGIMNIPKKGDAVWISCQNGDPRYMIWEYGWGFKEGVKANFPDYQGVSIYNNGYRLDMTDTATVISKEAVQIKLTDTGIELNDGSISVKVVNGKIDLGSVGLQPALLGENTTTLLSSLLDLLALSTVLVAGVPTPLSNAAAFTALKANLAALKSQTVKVST